MADDDALARGELALADANRALERVSAAEKTSVRLDALEDLLSELDTATTALTLFRDEQVGEFVREEIA